MINTKHVEEVKEFENNKFMEINRNTLLYKTKDCVIISLRKGKCLAKENINNKKFYEIVEDILDNALFLYNYNNNSIVYPDIFNNKFGISEEYVSEIYDLDEFSKKDIEFFNNRYLYIINKLETEIRISIDEKYKVFENLDKVNGNIKLVRYAKDLWNRDNPKGFLGKDYIFNIDMEKLDILLNEKYAIGFVVFNLNTAGCSIELYDDKGNLYDKEDKKYHRDYMALDMLYSFSITPHIIKDSFQDMDLIFWCMHEERCRKE